MSSRTRWTIVALLCVPVLAAVLKWQWRAIDAAYQNWRYPVPQGPAVTSLGDEILRQEDSKDMNRFLHRYHRIVGLVADAHRRGVDVGPFVGRLKDATILAQQGAFRDAMAMLNLIEMGLPKRSQSVQPAASDAGEEEGPIQPIEGRPVRPSR